MNCSHCERPTVGGRVLCKKCLRQLSLDAPHLLTGLHTTAGLNAALVALARAHDRQSYVQHEAYLKGRKRRLAASNK